MHNRAIVLAVFSCCCLLSACSGGGGSGTSALVPANPQSNATAPPSSGTGSSTAPAVGATASPTPSPTLVPSAYPMSGGDAFVYGGQLRQAFQSYPEVVAPGSPPPEPIASTLTNVTQNVAVTTGQTFNGKAGLTGLHDVETDALASGLETTTAITDSYEALASNGASSQLLSYGSQYTDEGGDTVSTLPNPATILDEVPDVAGATWANGPGATIDEAIAGNATGSAITVVRTVDNDGSYNEKTTYPPNYSGIGVTGVGNIQENVDGSGDFMIESNGGVISLTYSAPEPQPSGSPLITINEYPSLDTTTTPSQTFQIPSWYGATAALYGETDRDDGVVAIPSSCKLASTFPAQATALAQTITRIDTVLGYSEAQTTTSYVAPGYGLLCAVLADKVTAYYDFNGDEPSVFTAVPPLEITTTTETLALQPSSTIANSVRRGTASHAAKTPANTYAVLAGALRAHFDRNVRTARRHRLEQLMRGALRMRTNASAGKVIR